MGEGGRMTGIGIQRRTGGLGFFVFFLSYAGADVCMYAVYVRYAVYGLCHSE